MKLKMITTAALLSLATTVTPLAAQTADTQAIVDGVVQDLAAQGYSNFQVHLGPRGIQVEARGTAGELERLYDRAGNLLRDGSGDGNRFGRDDRDDNDDDRREAHGSGHDRNDDRREAHGSGHDRDDDHGERRGSGHGSDRERGGHGERGERKGHDRD